MPQCLLTEKGCRARHPLAITNACQSRDQSININGRGRQQTKGHALFLLNAIDFDCSQLTITPQSISGAIHPPTATIMGLMKSMKLVIPLYLIL